MHQCCRRGCCREFYSTAAFAQGLLPAHLFPPTGVGHTVDVLFAWSCISTRACSVRGSTIGGQFVCCLLLSHYFWLLLWVHGMLIFVLSLGCRADKRSEVDKGNMLYRPCRGLDAAKKKGMNVLKAAAIFCCWCWSSVQPSRIARPRDVVPRVFRRALPARRSLALIGLLYFIRRRRLVDSLLHV